MKIQAKENADFYVVFVDLILENEKNMQSFSTRSHLYIFDAVLKMRVPFDQ